MKAMCGECKYYKQNILIPCQGRCKVARVKRNWNSKSCQFYEKRELKAGVEEYQDLRYDIQ